MPATTLLMDRPAIEESTAAPVISPASEPLEVARAAGDFAVHSETFSLVTDGDTPAFHDLTELARAVVARAGVAAGTLLVSTRHTTCAVVVQEHEPLLLRDMADRLRRYAGAHEDYRHNDFAVRTVNMCDGECANGHAHCQHLLLGAAVTLPVLDGRPVLGLWQRVFLVELDRPRLRHYSVQVMGVRDGDDRR
jgi:secondary thiamine-phosphate synthase enzyme